MNYYYILAFVSILITAGAQALINFRYSKYKHIKSKSGLSGFEVAKKILDAYDLDNIYVVETKGVLSDHYDPGNKVIRLSSDIFHGTSIASASVAAHEVGHAIQYKEGNKLIKIRSLIYPVVNFCSKFGYIVIVLSLVLGMMQLFYAGIIMLCAILLFQLLTLPVEFDASKKGLSNLEKYNILNKSELDGAKSMLVAAALTYVASLATTIIEIFRLLLMARDDN